MAKLTRRKLLPLLILSTMLGIATLGLYVGSEGEHDGFPKGRGNVPPGQGDPQRDLWTITEVIFAIAAAMSVLFPVLGIWLIFRHVPGRFFGTLTLLWGLATVTMIGGGVGLLIAELAAKQSEGLWWSLLFVGLTTGLLELLLIPLLAGFMRHKTHGTKGVKGAPPPAAAARQPFGVRPMAGQFRPGPPAMTAYPPAMTA